MGEGIANWTRYLISQGEPILRFFESLNPASQIKMFEGLAGATKAFGDAMSFAFYQTTWLAGFTLAIILSERIMAGLTVTSTGFSATLELGAARAFIMEAATKAWGFATVAVSYITDVLTGKIAAQAIAIDFAATKMAVMTFVQNNLGTALAFVSSMLQAQVWIWANTLNWATDGAAMLVNWANAQMAAAAATTANAAATNLLTTAQIGLNSAWTYFNTVLLPIIGKGLFDGIKNLTVLIPNLAGLILNTTTVLAKYSLGLLNVILNTNLLSASTGLLSVAKARLSAILLGLQTQMVALGITLPAIQAGFIAGAKQVMAMSTAIAALAVKIAIFVLAFDAIGNTFQIFKNAIAGDEFAKSLEGIEGSVNNIQKSVNGLTIAPLNEVGQNLVAVFQDLGDRLVYFVSNLGAGQDRAKGFIDNIATGLVNVTNLITGGVSAADKYGESFRFITQAQYEAQQQALNWEAQLAKLNSVLDDGTSLIAKYGLTILEASDRTRLGKDGIKAFTDQVATQIEALDKNIAVLQNVKTSDKELQTSIQVTIGLYEKQKNLLLGRVAFLQSEAQATTETAISIDGLAKSYEKDAKSLERATNEKRIIIQEQQASGVLSALQASANLFKIDSDSYSQRLALASKFQAQIKALIPVTTGEEDLKKLNDLAAKYDEASLKAREDIAKRAIANREKLEKEQLDKLESANKKAESAFKISQDLRTGIIKQALSDRAITEEEATVQLAQIALDAANQEIQIIKAKIAQIKILESEKLGDSKKNNADLLALQSQLSSANLQQIDAEIGKTKALRDQQIQQIDDKASATIRSQDKIVEALQREITKRDQISTILDAQAKLEDARASLAKAQSDGVLQGIDQQIEKINTAAGIKRLLDSGEITSLESKRLLEGELVKLGFSANTTALEFLKRRQAREKELADKKREALIAEQAQQRLALELDIKRNEAARTRADIEAQISVIKSQQSKIDAQSNLEVAEKNKDPRAIASAKTLLDLANQNVALSQKQVQVVRQANGLGKETDSIQRQILSTQQKNAFEANNFKDSIRGAANETDRAKANTQGLNEELQETTEILTKNNEELEETTAILTKNAELQKVALPSRSNIGRSFSAENGTYEAARAVNKIIESQAALNRNISGFLPNSQILAKQRADLERSFGIREGSSVLASSDRIGKINPGFDALNNAVAPRSALENIPTSGIGSNQVAAASNQTLQQNTITIQDRQDPARDLQQTLVALGRLV